MIDVLVAAYKDKVQRDVLEETRASFAALLGADADSRRHRMSVDILRMSKLKIALKRFELQYSQVKEKCGEIKAIDDYIADIRAEIKTLSMKKNHGR